MRLRSCLLLVLGSMAFGLITNPAPVRAAELENAEWIWSAQFPKDQAPRGSQFFRKVFEVGEVEDARMEITCDNSYELLINGQRVAADNDWFTLDVHSIKKHLVAGRNVVAIHAANEGPGAAGLVARIVVKNKGGESTAIVTDASWKASPQPMAGWEKLDFDDSTWAAAQSFGTFGSVAPWGRTPLGAGSAPTGRFSPLAGFRVEEVVAPGSTGSLVNMAFNEQGDMIVSREGGPLLLVRDADQDGQFESITTFCEELKNCHGILVLGSQTFAVGDGPAGTAFYRLTDVDNNGVVEKVESLFKFRGGMGEHGPHAAVLGPDGQIYVMIGNHAGTERTPDPTSPHHDYYEGELIQPKYEDANGHAAGVRTPGGTVVRTDTNGNYLELYCGGFRNAFDIAVNREGDMFTYDSDMEWDIGLPWYRPTRVNHLTAGSEFGWRSGWSKWPDYYLDSLPTTIDIGRGSPTGLEVYDHHRFPARYNNAIFMCDWSQGRIVAVRTEKADGTYRAESETFLEGRPLNCSDIAVGPDGWLYFCVGGRSTQGSIFRIVSDTPAEELKPATGIMQAIQQPQLYSAWARARIRKVKQELGDRWKADLKALALNAQAPAGDRTKALDLLQLFGPTPQSELLSGLSSDADASVRAKAAYLLGLHTSPQGNARLVELLGDADPTVRRTACESLVRARHLAPAERLLPLLADPHRFVAWAARRALEALPKDQWQSAVLAAENPRVYLVGSVALLTLNPDRATVDAIVSRADHWLRQANLNDQDLLDLLRVVELSLYRGNLEGGDVGGLRDLLSQRYPGADWRVNRELARLLVYLQDPTVAPRLVQQLESDQPLVERIHVAMYARFLRPGWTPELRKRLVNFCEYARVQEGGNSFRGYITNAASDFLRSASGAEQLEQIAGGAQTPGVTLGLIKSLPAEPTMEQLAVVRELDRAIGESKSPEARELAKATLTVLGRGDERSLAYLHQVFETNPNRRSDVALVLSNFALTRQLRESDWQLLIRSLPVVEGSTAREVLKALTRFQQRGTKPEHQRQVILLGLKLQDQGAAEAIALLRHWTQQEPPQASGSPEVALAAWQRWFVETYPDQPEPHLPVEAEGAKWTYQQLHEFLSSDQAANGDAERGRVVFDKALCIKCHRYGNRGEGIGPDLTNVSGRFQRKEILESVIFPSQVISDQFAAKTVVTTDGKTYTGLVGPASDGVVVLQSNAEKVTIAQADIDEIVPSKKSAMPEGLFNTLTLEEIADLFAYLGKPPAK